MKKSTAKVRPGVRPIQTGRVSRNRRSSRKAVFAIVLLAVVSILSGSLYILQRGGCANPGSSISAADSGASSDPSSGQASSDTSEAVTPTATPTTGPYQQDGSTAVLPTKNPILLSDSIKQFLTMGTVADAARPANLGFTTQIYAGGSGVASYNRNSPIKLYDPADYSSVAGVLTFRGNNFRNAPSYGYVQMETKKLEQIWERSMGGLPSSQWSFSWSGTGWTGQPVMIQWSDEVRAMMNLYPDKKAKKGLVEVITASMDGNIYFYDLDDGKATRDPIKLGLAVKGTPAIDPRGYPILYVGQGDYAPKGTTGKMGFRIFSLIDQSLLYFKDTARDERAYRPSWGAQDSSPIVDGAADTLMYPCENGMIYTAKLNTIFDKANGKISITPEFVDYKYKSSVNNSQGVESSMAVYGNYGYFEDNSGAINCMDLNTMTPVWTRKLDDDSDVTPTLQQEGEHLYLYCGTEVDNQQAITGNYQGDAYVYKIDAMTGEVVWRNSYKAWTKNDVGSSGNDINGGIMGSLIVGKGKYSNLVIVSVCMTEGYSSGDTIAAFDAGTGKLVWDYKMKSYGWSSPVDVYGPDGKLYVLFADSASQIHLIDGDDGSRLDVIQIKSNFRDEAKAASGGNIESSPAVFGNILVIGTRGGLIAGVRLK